MWFDLQPFPSEGQITQQLKKSSIKFFKSLFVLYTSYHVDTYQGHILAFNELTLGNLSLKLLKGSLYGKY